MANLDDGVGWSGTHPVAVREGPQALARDPVRTWRDLGRPDPLP